MTIVILFMDEPVTEAELIDKDLTEREAEVMVKINRYNIRVRDMLKAKGIVF